MHGGPIGPGIAPIADLTVVPLSSDTAGWAQAEPPITAADRVVSACSSPFSFQRPVAVSSHDGYRDE